MPSAFEKSREGSLCRFLNEWNGMTAFLMRKAMDELPADSMVRNQIRKHLKSRSERIKREGAG